MRYIKEFYHSMFYFFYKLDFVLGYPWWSEVKAALMITCFEVLLVFSIYGFLNTFGGIDMSLFINNEMVSVSIVILLGLLRIKQLFLNGKWKGIIDEYDNLASNERKGKYIRMFAVLVLVIVIFSFSMYLLGKKHNTL